MSLSRLRFPVEAARGRRYPEPPHSYRNEFQRDRDRIVHSRAFRRLENKTQVFTAGLSDHFRNRLTHTIEVSQIARTVASVLGLDEDFTEALALVHDIGHPPFAHAGEAELDRLLSRFGEHFDHNLHALRIVESFEQRYARFPGLNLTFEVREGIVKHSRDFGPGESPELDEYLPGLRPPLEAQLIDLCDEVAYNTADLDDAYSAGLVATEELRQAVPQIDLFWHEAEMQSPGAPERVRMLEVVRGLVNALVTGLIEGTIDRAGQSGVASVEAVRAWPERLVQFSSGAADTACRLKAFLRKNVYHSPQLEAGRRVSTAHLAQLFDFFLEHPDRLPEGHREASATRPLHRALCDYIAGMTDGFLDRTYSQIFGSS